MPDEAPISEVTDAPAKGKKGGKGKKAEGEGTGKNPAIHIAQLVVRALWMQDFIAAHPKCTAQERNAAWKDARAATQENQFKRVRRALANLSRVGMQITLTGRAKAGEDAAIADSDSEGAGDA